LWFLFGLLTGLAFAFPASPGSPQTILLPKEYVFSAVVPEYAHVN